MADLLSHKLVDFHSISSAGASPPFYVSPHLCFSTFCFSPPKRRSSSPFSCRLFSHSNSNSPSPILPPPTEIVSTTECLDGSFLFKFGDPSEVLELDKGVNGISDSNLHKEEEGLDEEGNNADSISKAFRTENIIVSSAQRYSSGDVMLEPNAVEIESVDVAELAGLLADGTERDLETICLPEKEAPAEISNDDDTLSTEITFVPYLSTEGCDNDEHLEISEDRLNVDSLDSLVHVADNVADDHEVELMPKQSRLKEGLALEEEIRDNLPGNLLDAESFVNSLMVDDGDCHKLLADEGIYNDVGSNEISKFSVANEQTDTVSRGEEILSSTLALASGVASLTRPSEVLTGAEDAYFVADEKWFIVANSVSHWSLEGMKPGLYAHELLQNFQLLTSNSDHSSKADVREVLKQSAATVRSPGLASVLIAHFDNEILHVANIGDTGFIIIRDGFIHKSSSPVIHEFNLPVQMGSSDDALEVAQEYEVHLGDGDIIILATDGLFDNLYEKDVALVVSKSFRDNMKPKEVAEQLTRRAQEVGMSTSARCPFADEAEAAGYKGYSGGKPDHVTVVVSLVKKQTKPQ